MRRISAKYGRPGMVLARPVYDSQGIQLFESGATLDEERLTRLGAYGVGEILIDDPRVSDVPVQPLIAPELEAEAVQGLRQLMVESQGNSRIQNGLLEDATKPIYAMTRDLFPEVMGEPNAGGCHSLEDYNYIQPVKVAGLALLMGRRVGYRLVDLASLGVAALLMNIGYILLPPKALDLQNSPTEKGNQEFHKHPRYGAEILGADGRFGPDVVEAVLQHHERWDGGGHPGGLKGSEIAIFARILAIIDTYYDLVSTRLHRKPYMPHTAIEFIVAYSGELFDPDLVQLFARQVPLYPTGVTVKLNTGEVCIVSDANLGHIGRPVVRVCYDVSQRPVKEPYDVDLSLPQHQGTLVVQVLALIHRRTACRRPAEETKGCASESGIMVLKQKTGPRKGAPDRCYHVTTPTASKSPSTTTAWWPMPG